MGFIQAIDHLQICIPVKEEEQAKQFYIDLLGFTEVPKPDSLKGRGGFWLVQNGINLHIGTETLVEKGKAHPAFRVKHLKKVKAKLEEAGIKTKSGIPIPGYHRFDAWDPFNNRIEFIEALPQTNTSAEAMWKAFTEKHSEYKLYTTPEAYYFCDSENAANECGQLVLDGIKTATCSALIEYKIENEDLPGQNDFFIITNFKNEALCIIQNVNVEIKKYKDIDEAWAAAEGEGDRSLDYWKKVHKAFFSRHLKQNGLAFSEELDLVCESFKRVF